MSYLDKLLQGEKVEWRELGEVADLKRGRTITEKNKIDGNIPVISGGQQPAYYNAEYNREGEVITIAGSGAYAGFVSYWNEPIFVSDAFSVEPKPTLLNTRYVFHFLLNKQFWIYNLQKGSGVPHVYPKDLAKLLIPIPSLPIQKEIVRMLDAFTTLIAELTKELTARQNQYAYYRDKLLTFEEGEAEWKTLEEIAVNISSGGTPRTGVAEYYNGDIPWLRTQEVVNSEIWDTDIKITELGLNNSSAKIIPKNCVIVAMYGATVGRVGINKIPLSTNQACANIELDGNIVNYRYVYYYLLSQYEYIKSLGTGSQTNINARIVRNLQIPIPPLSEQARIVSILDKFDRLVHSISEGLPKEIALRQQQYEYYRDTLLDFGRAESDAR